MIYYFQDSGQTDFNCTVKVDGYGFFIYWKSDGKVRHDVANDKRLACHSQYQIKLWKIWPLHVEKLNCRNVRDSVPQNYGRNEYFCKRINDKASDITRIKFNNSRTPAAVSYFRGLIPCWPFIFIVASFGSVTNSFDRSTIMQ
jgi:hypothetical protein